MKKWTPKTTLIVAGVAVLGLWYVKRQATDTVKQVGQAVNPTNQDNVFNRGFESVYRSVTGSTGTPGGDLFDWMNRGE